MIISKDGKNLDTLPLNKNNEFGGILKKTAGAGFMMFKHPPENQMVYLEKGDSIMVYLNTFSFDESINFSGRGAEKSNFLTNLYLLNQKNNDLILSYYKTKPSEFAKKTDSIREYRRSQLNKLKEKYQFSEDFFQLANTAINYEFYDLRERYLFLIRKYYHQYTKDIPADFDDYRSNISFNNKNLQDYYLYLNFIDDYLRTKSVEYCEQHNIKDRECYNLNNYNNIIRRIMLVDSLIQNQNIRNNFLNRLAAQGIIFAHTKENIRGVLDTLAKINYSGEQKDQLTQMAIIQQSLLPGNNIGNLQLINTKQDTVLLKNITKKPVVIYPWSVNYPAHHLWQHKVIQNLKIKYPEVEFIGVNVDKNQNQDWLHAIENNHYASDQEFRLAQIRINEDLLRNYINKLIFIDPHGVIKQEDAQLNSPEFEDKILEFINSEY